MNHSCAQVWSFISHILVADTPGTCSEEEVTQRVGESLNNLLLLGADKADNKLTTCTQEDGID